MFPDSLVKPASSKLLLCVLDGLGDIPGPSNQRTPLEAARSPHLDQLASEGTSGLFHPVAAGVTPGSGPGHLALFGYDPITYQVGRGVLSALGVGFDLQAGDLAARLNFCTLDKSNCITDRRAGRIPTERNRALIERLRKGVNPPPRIQIFWETESEHRGVLVVRGPDLVASLFDTDPQQVGVPPFSVRPAQDDAQSTALILDGIVNQALSILKDEPDANGILLRGIAALPGWSGFSDRYRLRSYALTKYPMYRGVAQLVGMTTGNAYDQLHETPARLREVWKDFDYFFLHFKDPDKAGEDGDFDRKVEAIEEFDSVLPELLGLKPDVIVITGDHSTPVPMKQHSWHPVPVLLHAADTVRTDSISTFGERAAAGGGLGQQRMCDLMSLMLAHGGRLQKFGA